MIVCTYCLHLTFIASIAPSVKTRRNIARGKKAEQSSGSEYPAKNAIDGNYQTASLTFQEKLAWWRVDLGVEHVIEEVQLSSYKKFYKVALKMEPSSAGFLCRRDIAMYMFTLYNCACNDTYRFVEVYYGYSKISLIEVTIHGAPRPAPPNLISESWALMIIFIVAQIALYIITKKVYEQREVLFKRMKKRMKKSLRFKSATR